MTASYPVLSLRRALRAGPGDRIAFSGAGGKTTAIFLLARELLADSPLVFVTTTTHLSTAQAHLGDLHLTAPTPGDLTIPAAARGVIVVTGAPTGDERVGGLAVESMNRLNVLAGQAGAALLVEADGARMRPAKAPAAHEPAVPQFVDAVVVTAGLSVLGQPLTEAWVHRPERFSMLSGIPPGSPVSAEGLAAVLGHPDGGMKGIPTRARRVLLLNQADDEDRLSQGGRLAGLLLGAFDSVVLSALQTGQPVRSVREPAAAVVLAAGESSRMGRTKQLLDWRGKPLARHAAETALEAGCGPVIVVTGAEGEAVSGAFAGLPVQRVQNDRWRDGQSTSLQAGLRAVPEQSGSVVFLLADQPFVPAALVRALLEAHAASLAPIVAPLIDGQRGNPVLFDRSTFPELAALTGDTGGRPLFARHRAQWVPWHDRQALHDLDTPEDYVESSGSDDLA